MGSFIKKLSCLLYPVKECHIYMLIKMTAVILLKWETGGTKYWQRLVHATEPEAWILRPEIHVWFITWVSTEISPNQYLSLLVLTHPASGISSMWRQTINGLTETDFIVVSSGSNDCIKRALLWHAVLQEEWWVMLAPRSHQCMSHYGFILVHLLDNCHPYHKQNDAYTRNEWSSTNCIYVWVLQCLIPPCLLTHWSQWLSHYRQLLAWHHSETVWTWCMTIRAPDIRTTMNQC